MYAEVEIPVASNLRPVSDKRIQEVLSNKVLSNEGISKAQLLKALT